jgi:hypothetical protein
MSRCTTYHNDPARTGWYHGTRHSVPQVSAWRKIIDVDLGAAVRGAPLLLEDWTIKGGPLGICGTPVIDEAAGLSFYGQ